MKLVSLSVQNYRSIVKSSKLPIKNSTILIGPNNEGKSNILKALVNVLTLVSRSPRILLYGSGKSGKVIVRPRRFQRTGDYDWDRDFPISLQTKHPEGVSLFNLEFELTPSDIAKFKEEVKSTLTGTLPIQIAIGKGEPVFKVKKKGPGASALSKKSDEIALFIGKRLDFEYIPAIRTAQSAQKIVDEMVARELSVVEDDPTYKKAVADIEKVQTPILEKLSLGIKKTLSEFLPAVKDVKIKVSEERRSLALRHSCDIVVDDGTPTLLEHKGDGVQSISALSLMRQVSEYGAGGRHLILAIEEPESHLHPNAIHQLKQVLKEMSEKHQIIVTSHNPLFVDRQDISSNIIVTSHKATSAKNINEIRRVLGVRASDNLRNAELVLIVEGEDDRIALSALLSHASGKLRDAFRHGKLAIDSLLGGANLTYKLSQIRDVLCEAYVFLDHDQGGISASRQAEQEGLLVPADVTFSICNGMAEAEIEDMYNPDIYKDMLYNRYGVSLETPKFKNNKKWSDRLKNVFRQQGKNWDDNIEKKVKAKVANLISANPNKALNEYKRSAFDALISALEARI